MQGKRYSVEKIITMLRKVEILLNEGKKLEEAVRHLGICQQTYYRWRKMYGNVDVEQARKYKELELENSRLKRLVAEQALDISILKEVSKGNF